MSWSPTAPAAPGYYWHRTGPGGAPKLLTVEDGAAELAGEWMGPLQLPGGEVVGVAPPPPPGVTQAETRPG